MTRASDTDTASPPPAPTESTLSAEQALSHLNAGSAATPSRAIAYATSAAQLGLAAIITVTLARAAASLFLGPVVEPPNLQSRNMPAQSQALAVDLAILSRFDPFHRQVTETAAQATASVVEAAPETSLNLKLFGVHVRDGNHASAIIQEPRGDQRSFKIGDEIINGVSLVAVYQDYVEIMRGGVRESLFFPGGNAEKVRARRAARTSKTGLSTTPSPKLATKGPSSVPTAPAPSTDAQDVSGPQDVTLSQRQFEKLLRTTSLRPRLSDGRLNGYVIGARGNQDLLRDLGFKDGDILLAVDNEQINNLERLEEILYDKDNRQEITFTIERDSKPLTLRFAYVG